MTWAQRLKRFFRSDIETCPACSGTVQTIACLEGPYVIEKILAHLHAKAAEPEATRRLVGKQAGRGKARRRGRR